MLALLRFYYGRFLVKLTRKLHMFVVIYKKVGLKNLNFNLLVDTPSSIETKNISPDELYLGPDYLIDEFTLLNCPITKSPHFELIKTISCNGDIKQTDYFQRYVNGTLDWRDVQSPLTDIYKCFINKFNETQKSILEGTYTPVKVYLIDKRYYIYDGKHRAAFCAFKSHPTIKCEVIELPNAFGSIGRYMFNCIITKIQFSKHTSFYKSIYNV